MKGIYITILASCLFATQASAIEVTNNTPIDRGIDGQGTVDWNIIDDVEKGETTYWTKITGNYDIQLGAAAITMQSGGTLSVYTTHTDWSSAKGIGLTSNTDPYQVQLNDTGQGAQLDHMAVYIGSPATYGHSYPGIQYHVNTYIYECTDKPTNSDTHTTYNGYGTVYGYNKAGERIVTKLPKTDFSTAAKNSSMAHWNNPNQGTKMTFGFTMGAAMNEDGEITGLRLTVPDTFVTPDFTLDGSALAASVDSSTEGAQQVTLQTDMWIDRTAANAQFENPEGQYLDLPNMGYGFDLRNLRSYGVSTIDTNINYGIDPDAVTYIVITKSLRDEALGIPEPTTATLSLLALAGLAMRRRR